MALAGDPYVSNAFQTAPFLEGMAFDKDGYLYVARDGAEPRGPRRGLACGGNEPTWPVAGTATVSLVTPNSDDGVVVVTLTGPGLANTQSASSAYRVYFRVFSASEVRAIVVGNLAAGAVLTVSVDDLSKIGQYAGTVVEAASRSDVVRASLTGYGVTFAAR